MSALSKPYLIRVDTKSKPGKWVVDFVRFQTVELNDDPLLNKTEFHLFDPEDDPRAQVLHDIVRKMQ